MNIPLTPLRCLRYAEQQYSHRTAVVCGNDRFTYREFPDLAARLGGDATFHRERIARLVIDTGMASAKHA